MVGDDFIVAPLTAEGIVALDGGDFVVGGDLAVGAGLHHRAAELIAVQIAEVTAPLHGHALTAETS